jgi:hypothetical protein
MGGSSSSIVEHAPHDLAQQHLVLGVGAIKRHGNAPTQGRQARRRRHAELHPRLPQPRHAAAERCCKSHSLTFTHQGS